MTLRNHALLIFSAVFLLGCGTGEEPDGAPATEGAPAGAQRTAVEPAAQVPITLSQDQATGRQVYETVCWTCHGETGEGAGPAVASGRVGDPPDLTSEAYAQLTAAELQERFAPRDELDEQHPHMRVVRSLLTEERFRQALSYIPVLGYPAELPGAAMRGQEIYAFRCAACHGEAGEGDGPAADILATAPADFTSDTLIAAGDFEALFARIDEGGAGVHGSSMPPWGVIMSDGEIWDLVAYISTFQDVSFTPPTG